MIEKNVAKDAITKVGRMNLTIESSLSSYTEDEIQQAKRRAESIVRDLHMIGHMTFEVAEKLYKFNVLDGYKKLNFPTLESWIKSIGYSPRTYFRYMSIYKTLTVRLGIPREMYETADLSKIMSLKILADQAQRQNVPMKQQTKLIEEHVRDVKELPQEDLNISTNEKIRNFTLDNKRDVNDGETTKEKVINPLEELKPGAYKIVPLTKEERRIDPKINFGDMMQMKGVRVSWWYHPKYKNFVVDIK